jgi:hypothetical protein
VYSTTHFEAAKLATETVVSGDQSCNGRGNLLGQSDCLKAYSGDLLDALFGAARQASASGCRKSTPRRPDTIPIVFQRLDEQPRRHHGEIWWVMSAPSMNMSITWAKASGSDAPANPFKRDSVLERLSGGFGCCPVACGTRTGSAKYIRGFWSSNVALRPCRRCKCSGGLRPFLASGLAD